MFRGRCFLVDGLYLTCRVLFETQNLLHLKFTTVFQNWEEGILQESTLLWPSPTRLALSLWNLSQLLRVACSGGCCVLGHKTHASHRKFIWENIFFFHSLETIFTTQMLFTGNIKAFVWQNSLPEVERKIIFPGSKWDEQAAWAQGYPARKKPTPTRTLQ